MTGKLRSSLKTKTGSKYAVELEEDENDANEDAVDEKDGKRKKKVWAESENEDIRKKDKDNKLVQFDDIWSLNSSD